MTSLLIVTVLLAPLLAEGQAPAFKVVTHSSASFDSMNAKDLRSIFLKRKSRLPDGKRAIPVDLKLDTEVRQAFCKQILEKNPAQVESYWNGQVFSGKASPPPELQTDQEVLQFVRTNPGAIGYVAATTSVEGAKVIQVLD